MGLHDWTVQGELQEHIGVEEKLEHEEYQFPDNDLALLKLSKPVKWRTEVQPLCLPETKSNLELSRWSPNYGQTSGRGRGEIISFS